MSLDTDKIDALREISHIGADKASESLSQITGEKIDVEFPEMDEKELEGVTELLGDKDELFTAVSVEMYTDIEEPEPMLGRISLLMDHNSANELAQMMSGSEGPEDKLTEIEVSALKELGNILSGACLGEVSGALDFNIYESTPFYNTDLTGAVMQSLVLDMAETHDEILVFKTCFKADKEVDAYFILLFTQKGYRRILEGMDANTDI